MFSTLKAVIPAAALGVAAAMVAVNTVDAHDHTDAAVTTGVDVGHKAPDFTLQDQDGQDVTLSDHRGKVVVLEWFNHECPFVVKHYKNGDMNELAGGFDSDQVVFLAVNSTNGKSNDDNKKVHQAWSMNHPILNDSDGEVGRMYGATNTPHMYVIDREGDLAYIGAIDSIPSANADDVKKADNYVKSAVRQVLAGETVERPKTRAYGCSVKYAS